MSAGPLAPAWSPGPDGTSAWGISAPANLLLAGEYAVLEKGGLGIAVAAEVRARAYREPGLPEIRGTLPSGEVRVPGDSGLLGKVASYLWGAGSLPEALGTVRLDTASFFHPDGRKRGFGSSAALTVLLSTLWRVTGTGHEPQGRTSSAGGRTALDPLRDEIFVKSVAAHRAGQDGRGSGYDVACSTYGGVILFRGGEQPSALPVSLPWLTSLRIVSGDAPVSTAGAVEKYRRWAEASPEAAREYLARSNQIVEDLAQAESWTRARPLLEEYRRRSVELGDRIGVEARLHLPEASPPGDTFIKSIGAGNEIGIAIGRDCSRGEKVEISAEGVKWE